MLVAGIVCLMLFPRLYRLGEDFFVSSGFALLGVPFAYTAVVVATYCIGRGLHGLHVLNCFTLLIVYGAAAAGLAYLMTWWMASSETIDVLRTFVIWLVPGLVAAASAAFIWWRVVTRVVPGAPPEDEVRVRMRRRQRKGFFRRLANKW